MSPLLNAYPASQCTVYQNNDVTVCTAWQVLSLASLGYTGEANQLHRISLKLALKYGGSVINSAFSLVFNILIVSVSLVSYTNPSFINLSIESPKPNARSYTRSFSDADWSLMSHVWLHLMHRNHTRTYHFTPTSRCLLVPLRHLLLQTVWIRTPLPPLHWVIIPKYVWQQIWIHKI